MRFYLLKLIPYLYSTKHNGGDSPKEEIYLIADIIIIIITITINIMKVQALNFLSLLSIFLNRLQFRSVQIYTLFYLAVMTFTQSGTVDVILYLGT